MLKTGFRKILFSVGISLFGMAGATAQEAPRIQEEAPLPASEMPQISPGDGQKIYEILLVTMAVDGFSEQEKELIVELAENFLVSAENAQRLTRKLEQSGSDLKNWAPRVPSSREMQEILVISQIVLIMLDDEVSDGEKLAATKVRDKLDFSEKEYDELLHAILEEMGGQ